VVTGLTGCKRFARFVGPNELNHRLQGYLEAGLQCAMRRAFVHIAIKDRGSPTATMIFPSMTFTG
jgi:hypothetical protein